MSPIASTSRRLCHSRGPARPAERLYALIEPHGEEAWVALGKRAALRVPLGAAVGRAATVQLQATGTLPAWKAFVAPTQPSTDFDPRAERLALRALTER